MEAAWISLSRWRLASSSGAAFTSSRSWRIMLPIRITLAGCSTSSVMWRSPSPSAVAPVAASSSGSALAGMVPIGWPSGPTTTTCVLALEPRVGLRAAAARSCAPTLVTPRMSVPARSEGEDDLPGVAAVLHQLVGAGDVLEGHRGLDDRPDRAGGDERPDVLDDAAADGGLLGRPAGPAARSR